MRELNVSEINEVNGGENTIWYYVGRGIGATVTAIGDAWSAYQKTVENNNAE